MCASRIERLRGRLEELGLDAVVVERGVNIRYLTEFANVFDTGFHGMLAVSADRAVLLTDCRYEEQLALCAEKTDIEIAGRSEPLVTALGGLLAEQGLERAGIEDSVSVGRKSKIDEHAGRVLATTSGLVETLRSVKEPEEIEAVARSAELTDLAYAHVLPSVSVGASTRDIALELEWYMRTHGGQAAAFDLIVAAGSRSSMPHATTIEQRIRPGDFVKIDIGAVVDDYRSDMTRTVVANPAGKKHRRMFAAVLAAQERALESLAAGKSGRDVDAVARGYLAEAGFGENFGHGLGHGVGLEIHERPTLGCLSAEILQPGNVVTVEPGVYVPGFGGVRIEDLVVIEESGVRNLTRTSKELLVI